MLVDSDNELYLRVYDDGVLEGFEYQPDKTREFAGTHRYNTSVALAERYYQQAGNVSTVIIASGETQVDAVAAAGLAGYRNAPVLLTRGNRLPHNVARYIDRHNVTRVFVIGGTAVIPDDIVTAIEGLGAAPKVERLFGDDRYATAAAVAGALGGNPTWCGSSQSAAILVNGGDAGLADAVTVGPLAYELGLPVLMTNADELPESTVAFLKAEKTERVVIIGGMSSVSPEVIEELVEEVGVVTTRRISGANAAATSVAIAREMLDANRCGSVIEVDRSRVALVNRDATADGITAGPVLGQGFGGGAVPILLVDDGLPAAVSDYLASTPEVLGGNKTHLSIVAIGGSAVVSSSVMADAVAAAKTSPGLTSSIGFNPKTPTMFTVTFSDDVKLPRVPEGETDAGAIIYQGDATTLTAEIADGTALDPTLYRVNGTRIEALLADSATAPHGESETLLERIYVEDRTVQITLSRALKNGDVISVASGPKIGANMDMRPLEGTSHTVSIDAPPVDRSGPVVEIMAVVGTTSFDVLVTEPNPLTNAGAETLYMKPGGLEVDYKLATATDENAFTLPTPQTDVGRPLAPHTRRYRFTSANTLAKGDVIEVARNTFLDTGNRGNRLTRLTVDEPQKTLKITSVEMGAVTQTASATATIEDTSDAAQMIVTAKADGKAQGAAGNNWRIYGYADPSAGTAPLPAAAKITVEVDTVHNIISYTIDKHGSGSPAVTLFDLARALVANETFAANFTVSFSDASTQGKQDALGVTDATGVPFDGGVSKVAVRVTFNDLISATLGSDGAAGLAGAINNGRAEDCTDEAANVDTSICVEQVFAAPDRVVHITYTASNLANLPPQGGTRVIPGGVATGYAHSTGTPAALASEVLLLTGLRSNSSLKPFGADTFAQGS